VLDLGSGTGIVGLVAATCGGRTILTDLPDVLPHLQANIDANMKLLPTIDPIPPSLSTPLVSSTSTSSLSDAKGNNMNVICRCESLSWGEGVELESFMNARHNRPFDVVLGSDLVYEPQLAALLLTTLLRVCGDNTIGLYASDRRGRNGLPLFLASMNRYFICEDIPTTQMDPQYSYDQIRLISFTRRSKPLPLVGVDENTTTSTPSTTTTTTTTTTIKDAAATTTDGLPA
jgi:hypothetical protein